MKTKMEDFDVKYADGTVGIYSVCMVGIFPKYKVYCDNKWLATFRDADDAYWFIDSLGGTPR